MVNEAVFLNARKQIFPKPAERCKSSPIGAKRSTHYPEAGEALQHWTGLLLSAAIKS